MFLSYLQIDELFISLNLKIWLLETENCLEIEKVLKLESLETCKGKKVVCIWLDQPIKNFQVQESKMFVGLEIWQNYQYLLTKMYL